MTISLKDLDVSKIIDRNAMKTINGGVGPIAAVAVAAGAMVLVGAGMLAYEVTLDEDEVFLFPDRHD